MKKPKIEALAVRERQIVDAVYRLGEAGVAEVLADIPDPPSYSSVRAMLGILVQKGFLEYRQEKTKYLYRPVIAKSDAQKSILRNLMDTFFPGNPTAAVAALLDVAADDLNDADYRHIKKMIDTARKSAD